MATPAYAELFCRSNFSFLQGASHPEELVRRAHALGYRALALTDRCSLAGVVRAHAQARTLGLKLIVGAELQVESGPRLVALAMDRAGYGNLSHLITVARRRAPKGQDRLLPADLADGLPGCLTLWLPDPLADAATLRAQGAWLNDRCPGRLWIGVVQQRRGADLDWLARLRGLGADLGLRLTAGGEVAMHTPGRRALLDVLTAIRLGVRVDQVGAALAQNREHHLRTRADLARFYPPDLLAETLVLAGACHFSLAELRYEYPDELVPPGQSPAAYLRRLTEEGIVARWPAGCPPRVRDQIEHELALIAELTYEPYFLTVHDIVRFARARGILCQGRGSAANSAVCYCLGITEVDPARMDMLFERFISRERGEPPDIDVDFEHQRREEVIQYIYSKYGRERAALAAAVVTYRPRGAVRDVGKALGMDPDQLDRLARNLNWWDGAALPPQRLREVGLDPDNPLVGKTLRLVQAILGCPRHLSQHVGGFVISRGALSRLVPVENAAMAGRTVIQWDKDDLDTLGLLKVDCLALGMLSAIHRALDLINGVRGTRLTVADIPAEDPDVYRMIQRAETTGVFQIESRAQMAMLPRLKPACFYDLVIEVAIVRPGPIQGDMVHPYLRRRQGLEPVSYPSAALQEVLGRTLGVPIFQEQVIKVATVAAGFSPGEADQVRRSMAAWRRRGGLTALRGRLLGGMLERGYTREFAEQIYHQILGFGEYGFPESHAASFALLVYVSAWLKHHEPAAFFAALLNSQPMGFYAPAQLVREARRQGVDVRPVDVTASEWDCTLEPIGSRQDAKTPSQTTVLGNFPTPAPDVSSAADHTSEKLGALAPWREHSSSQVGAPEGALETPTLRLGLRLVKGLSRAGAERLVAARGAAPWSDLNDLMARAALERADLKALAHADALAPLAGHRHRAAWSVLGSVGLRRAPQPVQGELALPPPADPAAASPLPVPTERAEIVADYAALGLSLRRHPLALLRPRLNEWRLLTALEVGEVPPGARIATAGLVINRQRPGAANGVTFVTLEDETGQVNLVVWKQLAERQRSVLLGSRLLGVYGEVQREAGVTHLIARRLLDYSALLGGLVTRSRDFC
ncbi:error-prone DNA polymerase [uncultured Thiodictyon sp.]|uniref:error-prone DNA polymerase n=1 Tax=uncultured Thiodictyon sp. TaxID=1846217 RepID=UPI0025FAE935|nr:error-prone DNA polymerase [uncultured Thiodictyon sp.]